MNGLVELQFQMLSVNIRWKIENVVEYQKKWDKDQRLHEAPFRDGFCPIAKLGAQAGDDDRGQNRDAKNFAPKV